MMNSLFKVFMAFSAFITVQGCTPHTQTAQHYDYIEENDSAKTIQTLDANSNKLSQGSSKLQTCLFEADQLSGIKSGKYLEKKTQLYTAIREAKYYASISSQISLDTSESLTPYYQFKIKDICNEISHSMYNELKAGVLLVPKS